MKSLFLSLLTLLLTLSVAAAADKAGELKIAPPFSDGMVLQRGQPVPVWGRGEAGKKVTIELGAQKKEATVDATGNWRVTLDPAPEGGPYGPYKLIATCGAASVTVADVLVGDVWLCSGQSNMQMSVKECAGADKALKEAARYSRLRFLTVGRGGSSTPQFKMDGKWELCTAESAAKFTGVGYFFASELLKDRALEGVPIGIINSSFGGTAAEAWIPEQGLREIKPEQMCGSMFNIKPSTLFNGMIAPLVPFGLKGVVWYQGESNAGRPECYQQLLTSLITQWRQLWSNPRLPFIIVQLPAYTGRWGGHHFTWVREAQAKTAAALTNVGLIVTLDTHDGSNLHPPEKQEIGRRAALWARRMVYGQSAVVAYGPVFDSVEKQSTSATGATGATLQVKFKTFGKGLRCADPSSDTLRGFAVAGSDGIYKFASARIGSDGESVVLQCDTISAPATVRYAWGGVPPGNLCNADGLPSAPFRTDTLPPDDLEFAKESVTRVLSCSAYEVAIDGKGRVKSLGVHGTQFISNDLGPSGGTTIPGTFGPRELSKVTETSLDSIVFSGDNFAMEIACREDGMTWNLSNRGDKETTFRINLAPQVEIVSEGSGLGAVMELKRGNARLTIEGITESSPPSEGARNIRAKVAAKSSTSLIFRMQPK